MKTTPMQVKKIEAYFEAYKQHLSTPAAHDRLYIWESQRIFQDNWDLEATDLAQMYDQSLQNRHTKRLWLREAYAPKEMMLEFASMQPHYFRQMFSDLFAEDKSIDGRIGRFGFYCDQLFEAYKDAHPHSKVNTHYHDDGYQIISLYLSFHYPESYCPYNLELFQDVLQKIGGRNLPLTHDTERYFKICKTLFKLMNKHEDLIQLHRNRLDANQHYLEDSLLLIYDFNRFIVESRPV